jgi:hypothetical protein
VRIPGLGNAGLEISIGFEIGDTSGLVRSYEEYALRLPIHFHGHDLPAGDAQILRAFFCTHEIIRHHARCGMRLFDLDEFCGLTRSWKEYFKKQRLDLIALRKLHGCPTVGYTP